MKLDILAFGAHPDDVELSCAGTLLVQIEKGFTAGIIDLTRGELGTRGDAPTRLSEAERAAAILGIHVRENLEMKDAFFTNDPGHQIQVIQVIRKYRPRIVLCNAIHDRHKDHGRAADLVSHACFLSGLRKIETRMNGVNQEAWRPEAVYHYIQDYYINPDFVVDVTRVWEQKMKAVMAFSSQFFNPNSNEPETSISTKEFLEFLTSRAMELGRHTGFNKAEGFTTERTPGLYSLFDLK
ncbi:MAG: bacillithiol biosynthesis deacetylase BshB1 [Bacteroidia bacterium]|nr:bacillithiol biosynthesis deacetylase BshB1 [Bacteroidia bacterium]